MDAVCDSCGGGTIEVAASRIATMTPLGRNCIIHGVRDRRDRLHWRALAPRLVERGYRVRCLARSEAKLRARPWAAHERVEIVEGDAGDEEALAAAMKGCVAAY